MTTQTALSLQALEEAGALTPTGLRLVDPELPYDRYEAVGVLLHKARESLQWAIGDWLLLGETLYGDEAYQAFEVLDMSPEGRSQYLRCALVFPHHRRRTELSWSHHRTLIALEPKEQDRWLALAIKNDWSNHMMAAHLREDRGPVNHGRGANRASSLNPQFEVMAVEDAAREVLMRATPDGADPGYYLVPADAVQSLAHALGVDFQPDALIASAETEVAA